MDRLVLKDTRSLDRGSDVARLIDAAREHGCALDGFTARRVWEQYSETFAAGWLLMDDYDSAALFSIIAERTDRYRDSESHSERTEP